MKIKFLATIFISLFFNFSIAADKFEGTGQLTLNDPDVKWFHEYIKPPAGQSPMSFWVLSENGEAIWSTYWYCPEGACQTLSKSKASKMCVEGAEKYYGRVITETCKIFAQRRTIKWKNGTNPGRGKVSRVSSKFSEQDLRAKLTELGFLGGSTSSNNTSNSNDKTKKKSTNDDIALSDKDIKKLKDLKQLLDDGILTEQEFQKAKSKILKK